LDKIVRKKIRSWPNFTADYWIHPANQRQHQTLQGRLWNGLEEGTKPHSTTARRHLPVRSDQENRC